MVLYVATTNPGKLRDFALAAERLAGTGSAGEVRFETIPGLSTIPAPEEDQDSFEGNARLKAEYYSRRAPGLLVLADDSGLEVDALEGRPGVRSARFAADLGREDADGDTDRANNEALMLAMLEQTDRRGRYRCVLALARDGEVLATAEGSLEGEVLNDPEGDGGFGYDPLFYVPEMGCTMAQVGPEDRLRLSHRGRALRRLLAEYPALG
ncbi:non-canonical purine NTP pyrophosphatase [Terriglobus aquaticus]|uniref:dITP/XTP pyrophosphatase n=1 Tax=Terriglobus aquaticus TaxID=940139 RepID=A0ABW9KKX8_9BACT|nr:non-canonical purine NTP pyrophosphatase [Terriglobus aquaticus]